MAVDLKEIREAQGVARVEGVLRTLERLERDHGT